MGRPVGPDDTVGTEVGIVGLVSKVSAVAPVLFAVGGSFGDTVVQPLPDESPLNAGESFKGIKVVGKAAVAVAHGVRIFAQYEGTVILVQLGPAFKDLDT